MNAALAIFVKTPGLSPIKTRLARSLGEAAAIEFHRRSCAAIAEVACAARDFGLPLVTYWAVAEQPALEHAQWSDLPRLWQGEGDLGVRLNTIHENLQSRHATVLMIGADAPQINLDLLDRALSALSNPATPFVIGPAEDGGFWLFGARVPVPACVWLSIPYSQPDTAARLGSELSGLGGIAYLPALTDVDTVADLLPVRAALVALQKPLPQQRMLTAWLDQLSYPEPSSIATLEEQ
jgi:uncharacterized protein